MSYLDKLFNFTKIAPFEIEEGYLETMDSFFRLLGPYTNDHSDVFQKLTEEINEIKQEESAVEFNNPISNGQRQDEYFKSCKSVVS